MIFSDGLLSSEVVWKKRLPFRIQKHFKNKTALCAVFCRLRFVCFKFQTASVLGNILRPSEKYGKHGRTTIVALEKSNSLVEKLVGGVGKGIDSAKKDIRRALQ